MEIDSFLYCSADCYDGEICTMCFMDNYHDGDNICHPICKNYHHKWPTPVQYRNEYGVDYPEDGSVFLLIQEDPSDSFNSWTLMSYEEALENEEAAEENDYLPVVNIVCACTPWGKPPDDWRPK